MKTNKIFAPLLMGGACLLAALPTCHASPIAIGTTYTYDLTNAAAGSGLGTMGNFGTVTLTQAADEVDVAVALKAGYLFANTGGPHDAFVFNLGSTVINAVVTLTSFPNIFQVGTGGPFSDTPWGTTYSNAIQFKSSVGGGLSANVTGPLTFTVKAANLTLTNFVPIAATKPTSPSPGYIFSADVGNAASGRTGAVTTVANETPHIGHVPEPATIGMIGLGLLGVGFSRRRRPA
ncbi:MAG: PEP-CTERM sorting domain-containing protein [Herminiimonas sp.]|nr:PEP-CTERM sorting domain-containing protein [Herminiimonas sp.]